MIEIRSPKTKEEWEKYFQLRWEVLRKPWNQPKGSEKDNAEETSLHFMAIDDKNDILGVCRLQKNSNKEGQIRFMAVLEKAQGKGVGKKLIQAAELKAKEIGLEKIILQARENAVPFYLSCNYQIVEKTFLLFNSIQHYLMTKKL
ncbi:MAG: GNAT family N-acetyltransferase [Bacteroidia bacterium]